MKKTTPVVVGLLIVAAAVGFWFGKTPSDPEYGGKRLSEWLREWGSPPYHRKEAEKAFRALDTKAVPYLLWAVEHGRKSNPDSGLFEPVGSPGPMDHLLAWITGQDSSSEHYDEQRMALFALSFWANREDVQALLQRKVADPDLGEIAANILAHSGGEKQRALLIRLSAKGTPLERLHAIGAFLPMYVDPSFPVRQAAKEETMPAVIRALRDSDDKVRAQAAEVYKHAVTFPPPQSNHPEAIPILIDLLSDPSPQVRIESAAALGMVDLVEQRSKEPLLKMANEPGEIGCRVAANGALRQFGIHSNLFPELVANLESPDAVVRGDAILGLEEIGPDAAEALPKIVQAMEKSPPREASLLMLNFHKFGTAIVTPYMIRFLIHPDAVIRENAASTFQWDSKDTRVEAALTEALKDPEEKVRDAAKARLESIQRDRIYEVSR